MDTLSLQQQAPESPLAHDLGPHFRELARFHSTKALEASPLYARLRPEVERVLDGVDRGDFRRVGGETVAPDAGSVKRSSC